MASLSLLASAASVSASTVSQLMTNVVFLYDCRREELLC